MSILDQVKQTLASILGVNAQDFSYPPQSELGDLSLACFARAKELKQNPVIVAKNLEEQYRNKPEIIKIIKDVKAVGSYLNFFLKDEYLALNLLKEVKVAPLKFGQNNSGAKKTIMIKYSNGNTHKEYHVGHLRNICYGEAITRLLSANGYKVIPVSYINDFGIHVAKTLWFWDTFLAKIGASAKGLDKGYLLGKCYSAAAQKIEEYDKAKAEVAEVMKAIESRNGQIYKLWQTTRKWSLDYFARIYKELRVDFKNTFYESNLLMRA